MLEDETELEPLTERQQKILELGECLSDALAILNDLHDTRELAIVRTELQKIVPFFLWYVFVDETGQGFTITKES